MVEQLASDAFLLSGFSVTFTEDLDYSHKPAACLQAGKTKLGWLIIEGVVPPDKQDALQRWLTMAASTISEEIQHHHHRHEVSALPAVVTQATAYIHRHFRENIRFTEVASSVSLSPERLSRLFHSCLGVTYTDYLNQMRLEYCRKELTHGNRSIADVAFASGFQSLSQFNRRFKAAELMTPREYQRRHTLAQLHKSI